jgi:predicted glycosyltransferase
MRFLFYSHDGLGLGHSRRNAAIAEALTELAPAATVLLVSGIDEVAFLGLPESVGTLKLPSLRKTSNGSYAARKLRISASEIRALRSSLLTTTVQTYRPSVVLVDKHPFGASGEFREGLETLRTAGGRAVLGLRDILDDREAVRREWGPHHLLDRIPDFYDSVLVYGHAAVFNPITEYDFPREVAQRTRFCGYVVNRENRAVRADMRWAALALQDRNQPVVLATTGGGEDGSFLLETFIRASVGAPWQGVAIAGPMTPDYEFKILTNLAADANVKLHTFVPDLPSLFSSADALVCMGGYNTLAEAASKGMPAVCVPRISPRSEQLMRASAFERLKMARMLPPEKLNVEALREHIEAALGTPRQKLLDRVNGLLRFDGAHQAAAHLLALATSEAPPRPAEAEWLAS